MYFARMRANELNDKVEVKTYHSWFSKYWWNSYREYVPQIEKFVYEWDTIIPRMLNEPKPPAPWFLMRARTTPRISTRHWASVRRGTGSV